MNYTRPASGGFLLIVLFLIGTPSWAPAAESANVYPNATAHISLRLANHFLEQQIDRDVTFDDVVLGARTRGEGNLLGQLNLQFVPSPDAAQIVVRLAGKTHCPKNVSSKGPATIFTSSVTSVDARINVEVDDYELRNTKSWADCRTSSQILDVQANRRLIERMALRRACRMKGEAELAASERTRTKVLEELGKEIDQRLITVGNDILKRGIRDSLQQENALPQIRFSTTESLLQAALSQGAQAAIDQPAPPLEGDFDVALQLHESIVESLAESLLGGTEIEDAHFLSLMELLTGSAPRPLWVHERSEPWSVTFRKQRPVEVTFRNDTFAVRLHFQQVRRGDRISDRAVTVAAELRPERGGEGLYFVRPDALQIAVHDQAGFVALQPTRESETVELEQFLEYKFAGVFPEQLYLDGLVAPAGGNGAKLRDLQLQLLNVDAGWARIGYQLTDTSKSHPSESRRQKTVKPDKPAPEVDLPDPEDLEFQLPEAVSE